MKIALAVAVLLSLSNVHSFDTFFTMSTSEVDELLSNTAYVKNYMNCVLGKVRCDNFGNQLKLAIPEVLGRNCRSCSAQQATNARKVMEFMKQNFPAEFQQILLKYRIKSGRRYLNIGRFG